MSAAGRLLDALRREVGQAMRGLAKSPGLVATSVVALGLGIGLTGVMFSIVDGALLKGLPFERSDRILHLEQTNLSAGIESMEVPLHDFLDWREQQSSFEDLAAFYDGTVNVAGAERPERYSGAFISANAFRQLRVQPAVGRAFREGEDAPGAEAVMLLGWHVWQDRYGGDPSVLGRILRVNGEPHTVVGVMPEGFRFPIDQDVWIPLRLDPAELERREGTTLEVFGRLRDGVDRDRATADLAAIASRLASAYPEANEGVGVSLKPYTNEYIGDEPRTLLWTMLGAVFLVLLIACANVANLLLARTAARARELAVRSALGASRLRTILQLLGEAAVLAAGGAVLGSGIAWVGIRLFNRAIAPTDPPFWIQIGLDGRSLAAVAVLAAVAALVSGVVPALQASGAEMNEILKDESRGSSGFRVGRLSRGLVVAEVALSVGLLVGAGLMIQSVVNLGSVDYDFRRQGVFTARFGLFDAAYPEDGDVVAFFDELGPRLRAIPGVSSATLTSSLPGVWSNGTRFALEGESYPADRDYPTANFVRTDPGYFETFGVEVLEGRGLESGDRAGSLPVAVVNESFARRHFPDDSPLGRRIRVGDSDSDEPWLTVVGVVPDLHLDGAENEDPEGFYVPLAQSPQRFVYLALAGDGDAMALSGPAGEAVTSLDPDLPLYWVQSLESAIAEGGWFVRVFGVLFIVFGAAALFLASVGLYGVTAASVSRRTREMGIRMALGAQPADVLRLIVKQGMSRIAVGAAVGLVFAALISRGLEVVLFGVEPWDPWIFAVIVGVLALTGLVASWVPARRATRVDPMVALRYE